jgi:heme oxygenase (biliverdin-producing, ferredoxin)
LEAKGWRKARWPREIAAVTLQFSARLRLATRESHRDAEASPFLAALFAGRLTRRAYAALLEQLVSVYACLDDAGSRHRASVALGAFFDRRLARGVALAKDLAVLGPSGTEPIGATADYCGRLSQVGDDPLLVLAHHYTRYLGDLSGGRAIAGSLQRTMSLTPESGLAFYQFDVGSVAGYKRAYRQRMDALDLSEADQVRFIREVRTAFTLNKAVFTGLQPVMAQAQPDTNHPRS